MITAAVNHGQREVISLSCEGGEHRSNWRTIQGRAKQVAAALRRMGMKPGDRVATLAWNTWRHVESWYGISGMGGVAHTINPRLFEDQIVYIANHAEDRVLFFDLTFVALVEKLAPRFTTIEHYVLLTDRAHMPANTSLNLLCYEDLIAAEDPETPWTVVDENAPAGLCYTSGTTGNPKGVQYSHRSNVLHAMAACMTDTVRLGARSVVMPIAPMYHANAWSIPYTAALARGAKLVMAGPHFDPPTLQKMIVAEGCRPGAGGADDLARHAPASRKDRRQPRQVEAAPRIGGSAVPRSMIESFDKLHGVRVMQLWGMTEMSPLGTIGTPVPEVEAMAYEQQLDYRVTSRAAGVLGVEMKTVGDDGKELPRDGKAFGRLLVRGPWIVGSYFKGDGGQVHRCRMAGSTPATSRRSTNMATCTSSTGRRMSSSRAANGSRRSTLKTPRSARRGSPKRR